jgi:hypothetical protein
LVAGMGVERDGAVVEVGDVFDFVHGNGALVSESI